MPDYISLQFGQIFDSFTDLDTLTVKQNNNLMSYAPGDETPDEMQFCNKAAWSNELKIYLKEKKDVN